MLHPSDLRDEWHIFLKTKHDARGVEGREWLAKLLRIISANIQKLEHTFDKVNASGLIDTCFDLLAAQTGNVTTFNRATLMGAFGGDYQSYAGTFEEMDADDNGEITRSEWHDFMQYSAEKRGNQAGGVWIHELLKTLISNATAIGESWERHQDSVDEVFDLLAAQTGNVGVFEKENLLSAWGDCPERDEMAFETMDADHNGTVARDEWHRWLHDNHNSKGGEGDAWLGALLTSLGRKLDDGDSEEDEEEGSSLATTPNSSLPSTSPAPVPSSPSEEVLDEGSRTSWVESSPSEEVLEEEEEANVAEEEDEDATKEALNREGDTVGQEDATTQGGAPPTSSNAEEEQVLLAPAPAKRRLTGLGSLWKRTKDAKQAIEVSLQAAVASQGLDQVKQPDKEADAAQLDATETTESVMMMRATIGKMADGAEKDTALEQLTQTEAAIQVIADDAASLEEAIQVSR